MKHSNVFYKRNRDGQHEPLKDARAVRNKAGLDLFRVGFTVSEGKTGMIVNSCDNMEQVEMFVAKLETDMAYRERRLSAIEDEVNKRGLTPRYTRPDEKYADLFPKPEQMLALSLSDGKKHYFSEVYNQDEIALYYMKSQGKKPWSYLYLLYDGWMIDIGNVNQKDIRIEEYKESGIPDFRQMMTDRLEEALADPDKWANMYFANFLGRMDEAQAHNQPIQEARKAENQAHREERARREEEQRLAEQREYEAAIFDAEQSIRHKRELVDDEVRGTSLILQLFRENGVELPLKTQGWVKSSLHSICYNQDQGYWSYRYGGRNQSTVFSGYLDKLAEVIEQKYAQAPAADAIVEPENEDELEP